MTGHGPIALKRGLSLIEALIAIAILGIAFSGLLSWRQTILRQHQRLEAVERVNRASNNAAALLADVNPMAEPAGTRVISQEEVVSWQSTPLTTRRRSTAYAGGEGDFIVALYRMDVRIEGIGPEPSTFTFERLGWSSLDQSRDVDISQPR
jgi:prepilin-type N-terminal cleavage/methylation domain-containing protein